MPNRTITLALLTLAACATEPEPDPATSIDDAALICGFFCDPDNFDEPQALDFTLRAGRSLFPGSAPYGPGSCADIGPDGSPLWDCVVSLVTTANPCGTVAVECVGGRCNWQALDGCH